jgi:hypothetical protein
LLAICAVPSFDRALGWLTPDSSRWQAAHTFYTQARTECDSLPRRAPHATIVDLDSGHYVFMDQREAVVKAMRSFLGSIKQ